MGMKKPLKNRIVEVKELLEADDKQMARHLRISLAEYRALESGARVLPLPSQRSLERRMKGLLDRCGLKG